MSWRNDLQQASFRGVQFDVVRVSDLTQRAAAIAEYPYAAGGSVEDLGDGARRIRLSAVLWSQGEHNYLDQLKALEAALATPGPGELVHPIYGLIPRALCVSLSVEHVADTRDACEISLEFVRDEVKATGNATSRSSAPYLLAEAVIAEGASARAAADRALVRKIDAVRDGGSVPSILRLRSALSAGMGKLRTLADSIDTGSLLSELDPLLHPRAYMADARSVIEGALNRLPFAGLNMLSRSAGGAVDGGLSDFGLAASAWSPAAMSIPNTGDESRQVQAHAQVQTATGLAEAAAIVLAGELETPILSRADIESVASNTRSTLQAAVEATRTAAGDDNAGETAETGVALRSVAIRVQEIAQAAIERHPPVIRRASPITGPARLLSHVLYGNHNRAPEIARLNGLGQDLVVRQGEVVYVYAR